MYPPQLKSGYPEKAQQNIHGYIFMDIMAKFMGALV